MGITEKVRSMGAVAAMVERGSMLTQKPLPLRYWAALRACRAAGMFGGAS